MITLIAAAIAAASPAAPMQMPANAPAMQQDQQHDQMGKMAQMKNDCCCKEMMEKMHSGQDMDRMQDHREHGGQ